MEKFGSEELKRIGMRIRNIRKQRNMSQADLANKAKVGLPRISPIELGKTEMYISTLVKIAEALDVSTDEILRPNTPAVNSMYQSEFQELLGDCSPEEVESIINIVRQLKVTMRVNKTEE